MSDTPQPMSDAEISRMFDEAYMAWGPTIGGPIPSVLFARAILAARDAQWVAMLGEPVAVADMDLVADHMGTVVARAFVPVDTPLYAIKETP